jgi:phosphatidylglycerophosphate synthase
MNLFAFRKNIDRVLHPIVSSIARLPLHANHWTLIGALIGLGSGAALLFGYLWVGFAALLVRGLVDHIDGFKARNYDQRSTFGAVMDDTADRWVLGVMLAGGCLWLAPTYPHVLIVMALGITGALVNVIIKLSVYAEAAHDIRREHGKIHHPIDVVGMFGSAEFIIYFGAGVFGTAVSGDPRPMLVGCWVVAAMAHLSLLQRIWFTWKRYRRIDPVALAAAAPPASPPPSTTPPAPPPPASSSAQPTPSVHL